jgi:hypothetical protein
MTLNELMDELQDLKDSGVSGGTEVRVYADHGQMSMTCGGAGISYIEEEGYSVESIHPDDLEDYPDAIKVVEVWG